MSAGKLDLYIEQGATFTRKIIFKDPSDNLIDLTGSSFEGKIRKSISDATVIVAFTCTILNQTTNMGEMTIELSHTQTSAIPLKAQKGVHRVAEDFAYDVEQTYPGGKKRRILEGVASVSPEVTK